MEEIRQCPQCEKRFILSKGFSKNRNSDGSGYRRICKICVSQNEIKRRRIRDDLDQHFYDHLTSDLSQCKHCGMKRKRVADFSYSGKFVFKYLVNKKWSFVRPDCDNNILKNKHG